MNRFYRYHPIVKWSMTIVLLLVVLAGIAFLVERTVQNPLNYLLIVFFVPVAQFTLTPIFTLTGGYRYYSPLLLGYLPNDKLIDLHSGTSFDYLFVMAGTPAGVSFRRKVMKLQLEGLLNLADRIERGEIPETVSIVGTSYFFSERTATRLGFELQEPSVFYRLNLLVNFIDLTWMYSLSQGKMTFPKLWKAKKVCISGAALVAHRQHIQAIHARF